ncbi:MAG: prolyl oligopeptidase family serine peptidase [Parvularculaceae bacterium]
MMSKTALYGALALLLLAAASGCAHAPEVEAGFNIGRTPDGVEFGVWSPAAGVPQTQRLGLHEHTVIADALVDGGPYPLVIMSHGTGGHFSGHADTAAALARKGFIVAALTHPGDNWRDQSRATQIEDRVRAFNAFVSYMLEQWPQHERIDKDRVGAFGFSAGGFTVLAAAGGRPDLSRIYAHCAEHPDFFDCGLINAQARSLADEWPAIDGARLKALAVAAPALGFTFDRDGLKEVAMPVQLWRADQDEILPAPYYADAVREALPLPPEFHHEPLAGHFDFLAPCIDQAAAPEICESKFGLDRDAFHQRFNAEIVRFFEARLK